MECHVCARQRRIDGDQTVLETFGGRYLDRFERRDGEWRIAHRTVVHEWDKVETVELAFPPGRFTPDLGANRPRRRTGRASSRNPGRSAPRDESRPD